MAHSLLLTRSGSRVATIAGVLGAAAVLAADGGCLYTDPINMPPTIMIVPPTAVWIHEPVSFTATASDPNGDAVIVAWMHTSDDCTVDYSDPARWPFAEHVDTYEVVDPADAFCVWASATDRYGAVTVARYQARPAPKTPHAVIEIVHPVGITDPFPTVPLYTELEFSGAKSIHSVMDPLTFKWSLSTVAPGSQATLKDCPPGNICLSPDMPGIYEVALTAVSSIDPKPMSMVVTQSVKVAADQLPCLGITTPGLDVAKLTRDPATDNLFSVQSVVDDGDPYPLPNPTPPFVGTTHFSWFVGPGVAPVKYIPSHDFPSYTVPAKDFSSGDSARVRVEIHDRNPMTDSILLGCGDDALCEAPIKGCFLRMTWSLTFL